MNFHSIYSHGFARVAACTIVSSVANPSANATAIIDAANACHEKSVAVAVFPEVCLSGYAIEDLLLQDALLDATERVLATVVEASTRVMSVLVVGAPRRQSARVYNCAVVVHRGVSSASCRKLTCRPTVNSTKHDTSDRVRMSPVFKLRSV